ncbi:flavodoxin family protein [Dissulfurirhabdus thermomarina]|uniref:Flavodoxin family protein n=1 Tax=Dissulfurirhabdus thermomarina TaxID=1765737 RepID=A0A6N9TVM7_DISTH|nr:flavodoxin family protein [Dissulfurirhabdus thermomarina]NDY43477.1 flavodoxin family protein [Dissulfurirhabdus thermomarina]NMX23131.1 flavodoxin family protein [Dissulfurirhabdus thermomarina]
MTHVLGLAGSPRRGGNTEILLDALLEGAAGAGAAVERVRLADKKISPCIECGGCDATGVCVLDDDMTPLYDALAAADAVVLASPMFFYNITAFTQAVVERSQACWVGKHVLGRGPLGGKRRRGFFLSVGATRGARLFEGARLVVRYFFDAVDADPTGALLYRGIEKRGEIRRHPAALDEARAVGARLGAGDDPAGLDFVLPLVAAR